MERGRLVRTASGHEFNTRGTPYREVSLEDQIRALTDEYLAEAAHSPLPDDAEFDSAEGEAWPAPVDHRAALLALYQKRDPTKVPRREPPQRLTLPPP